MGTVARAFFTAKTLVAQRPERRMDKAMKREETVGRASLEVKQASAAMALARHAFLTTDFYRHHFTGAGFTEADLRQPTNFDQLPFVTKSHIRGAPDAFVSSAARLKDLLPSRTGGSTGQPLQVLHDRKSPIAALWWRAYRWWGVSPASDVAHIYRKSRSTREELLHRLEWWPTRSILLDARAMDPTSMRAFGEEWRRVRPALINGYVDGIHQFAQFVLDEGMVLPAATAIAVTASVLQPSQRTFIEEALGSPVYDCYRSAEVPWMAAQCRERVGLHVLADARILEIVDEEGVPLRDGAEGEIVVTDLWNRAFPLLRYRMGDRSSALIGDCECGMTLPRIASVQGRLVDVLRTPSGRMVTGGLGGLFNAWPMAVTQFQIQQLLDYTVILRCVIAPSAKHAEAAIASVVAELRHMLNNAVPVVVVRVDRIDHVGGKTRLVLSEFT